MSRDQLVDVATRLIKWINTAPFDPEPLVSLAKPDVAVPIPYPGSTPDYNGLLAVTKQIHDAAIDFKMAIRQMVVDETESSVVMLLNCTGVHAGEWLGIQGTNKKFDDCGFMMLKIDPATNLCVEVQMIFQDLLFLQQIGVLPEKIGA